MLSKEEIEDYMDDEDMAAASYVPTASDRHVVSCADMISVATRTQISFLRSWQTAMRGTRRTHAWPFERANSGRSSDS